MRNPLAWGCQFVVGRKKNLNKSESESEKVVDKCGSLRHPPRNEHFFQTRPGKHSLNQNKHTVQDISIHRLCLSRKWKHF
jgi:hypothetical protein